MADSAQPTSAGRGTGRPSTWVTESIKRGLEAVFRENPKPSVQLRADLALRIGVPEKKLAAWFQNRNAKEKRLQEREQERLQQQQLQQQNRLPSNNDELDPMDEEDEEDEEASSDDDLREGVRGDLPLRLRRGAAQDGMGDAYDDDKETVDDAAAASDVVAPAPARDPIRSKRTLSADAIRLTLPPASLVAVEHPCYVLNASKGLRMLGGAEAIAQAEAASPSGSGDVSASVASRRA